jgi:hypothetical protein
MYRCKKCNETDLFTAKKSDHYGLYCKRCLSWIKWIPIVEVDLSKPIHDISEFSRPSKSFYQQKQSKYKSYLFTKSRQKSY